MKYKTAINIDLSFPAGGDKGPKRNIGIITPGIMSKNPDHPLMLSPSARIMATTKNPIHVIGSNHPVAFWSRSFIVDKSFNKYKKFCSRHCSSKIICTFVTSILNSGAVGSPNKADFFIVRSRIGVVPPSVSCNGWLIPGIGIDNGKGGSVFCRPVLKLIKMSKNVPRAIGTSSAISAKSITYPCSLTGDLAISRQEFYCSNLSYQNQFNQDEERRES